MPDILTQVGFATLVIERLKELQRDYDLEQDPRKKRDILDQTLALVRIGWEQLFAALSDRDNPHQLLLVVAELNRVFEEHRAHHKTTVVGINSRHLAR